MGDRLFTRGSSLWGLQYCWVQSRFLSLGTLNDPPFKVPKSGHDDPTEVLHFLKNLMSCPHRPEHTHNLVGRTYLLIFTLTHVYKWPSSAHTTTVGGTDSDETQLSLWHGAAVGGPALHVSHSGISVALSQSKIVFMGLLPHCRKRSRLRTSQHQSNARRLMILSEYRLSVSYLIAGKRIIKIPAVVKKKIVKV